MGKHIIFFMPECRDGGGAERMTLTYAAFAKEQGYVVDIVVIGRTDSGVKAMADGEFPITLVRVYNIWDFGVAKLIWVIKTRRPDIVFSSFHYLNVRLILAAKLVGNTRVVVRSENRLNSVNKITRSLVKKVYRFSDLVIAQTDEMKEELLKFCNSISRDKVIVLYNPIYSKRIDKKVENVVSPYSAASINIVAVTRFSKQKGLDILIHAFEKVHYRNPNIMLNIVGGFSCDDPIKCDMDKFLVENNLQNNVVFWGFQVNPYPFVKYADCFVLSSRWEGLPNALIEAQYLQVPSVATCCIPSIYRIIQNGVNGYVVPVDDSDAFADAIINALKMKNVQCIYNGTTAEEFCAVL